MTLDKDVRIVRPRFIKDYTGKEWFRPGVGIHHSQLLELSTRKLMTIAKNKEEIVISAEVGWKSERIILIFHPEQHNV